MPIRLSVAAVCLAVMFSAAPGVNADHGEQLHEQCAVCHGTEGENRIEGFPNLANQNYKYLVKQLHEMRNSAKLRAGERSYSESATSALIRARRSNETMDPFVVDLTDDDIEHLAEYYATKPCRAVMRGAPLPPPKIETRCRVCHGKYGIAKSSSVPNIAGQDMVYLEQQLHAFKDGRKQQGDGQERRRAAMMESQVRHLSDQDIEEISLYYSRLPCR